jgi:hypothetical protein
MSHDDLMNALIEIEEGFRCAMSITSRPPDISGSAMYDRASAALSLLIATRKTVESGR